MGMSEDSLQKGRDIRTALTGSPNPVTAATGPAFEQVPDLSDLVLGVVFGEVWGRPGLDLKTRSAVTMAILVAHGKEPQLRGHIGYALTLGWSPAEIKEMFIHTFPYSGLPGVLDALRIAGEVFKERGVS
jgi:4-carboxymuconolactone decarboxylase